MAIERREYDETVIEIVNDILNHQYDKESVWIYCKDCHQTIGQKYFYEDRPNDENETDVMKKFPNCDYYKTILCTCHRCETLDFEKIEFIDIIKIMYCTGRSYGIIKALFILTTEKERKRLIKHHDAELKALELMSDFNFKTVKDTEEIYYYNDGIYHEGGEVLVKHEAERAYPDITITKVKEIVFHLKAKTYTSREEFNKHKNFIYLNNCIFDLKSMGPLEFNPDLISTAKLPIDYDKNAETKKAMRFIEQVLDEHDQIKLQEIFGYCLLRDYRYHKAFLFEGDGSNGKTTMLSLLIAMLGEDNVSCVAMQSFDKTQFASAQLYGKLANIYDDLPSNSMKHTGIFKMLSGGGMVEGQKKFQPLFKFKNYAKLIFSTNQPPKVDDKSEAFYRRIEEMNFPNTFKGKEKDPDLLEKITTPEELSGVFNWAVEGLKRLMENGQFSYELQTDERREHYLRSVDPLYSFCEDMLVSDPAGVVTKEKLYSTYIKYCKKTSLPTMAKNVVGRELPRHMPNAESKRKPKGDREYIWTGIKIIGSVDTIEEFEPIDEDNDQEEKMPGISEDQDDIFQKYQDEEDYEP